MRFEFATATRISFGEGVLSTIGEAAAKMGKRALLVLGHADENTHALVGSLGSHAVAWETFAVDGEPTLDVIHRALDTARQKGCDFTIGCGGGSAMDTAKAVSVLLANGGDPLDYLEVVGGGKILQKASLPCITIPTTAGTGSEVTRNAVIGVPEQKVKVSLRSATMLPQLALVDPCMTYNLPPEVTANTGLDALTQLVEPFVSIKANPITDALCKDGMSMAARSLVRAYQDGSNVLARREMSLASLYGGLALANAGLGGAHGFAGPIGGMFHAPHGAICARMLPLVIDANLKALKQREPASPSLARYDQVARLLTNNPQSKADDGVRWLDELCAVLHVRPLSDYGVTQADIPAIAAKSAAASSMKGNPIVLTKEELEGILIQAL